MIQKKHLGIIVCLLMLTVQGYAQKRRTAAVEHDTLSIKERISIHTNAIDWIVLTPNIGVEFDLSDMDWGRNTILFSGKWNGNSSHTLKPAWVFNRMELRGEYRHYFRTQPGGSLRTSDTAKISLKDRFNYLVGEKKKKPRTWRAYYYGGYASYGNYSIKLAKEGKQGTYISAGASFGFGIPLYSYKENSLDFELGGSLGFVFTRYDVFTHDAESNCYPRIPEKSKNWHVKPYPIPTNLHVSFVYRFRSIKNKYKAINHALVEKKQAEEAARMARRDSIKQVEEAERLLKQAKKDSLQLIKNERKEAIRLKIEEQQVKKDKTKQEEKEKALSKEEKKVAPAKEEEKDKKNKKEEKPKKEKKEKKEKAPKEKKSKKKDKDNASAEEATKKEEEGES